MFKEKEIIDTYIKEGKITEEQGTEILEKCAAVRVGGLRSFFGKKLKSLSDWALKSKEVAKATAKKDKAIKAADDLAVHLDKGIQKTTKGKISTIYNDPQVQMVLKRMLISGGIGLGAATGATIARNVSERRSVNNALKNLMASDPKLISKENIPVAKRAIKEVMMISPLAATNDNIVKNYVKKALKKQVGLKEMSDLAKVRTVGSPSSFRRDFKSAKDFSGDLSTAMVGVPMLPEPVKAISTMGTAGPASAAVMSKAIQYTHPEQMDSIVAGEYKAAKSPDFTDKMFNEFGGHVSRDYIEEYRQKVLKRGPSIYKEASAKKKIGTILADALPVMAGLGAIGLGIGGVQAGISSYGAMKDKKKMSDTFDVLKRDPDFKGKEKSLKIAFRSLAKFAPALATQPETAMPFVRSAVLDYGGERLPQILPSQVKELVELQKNYDSTDRTPIVSGFGKGFEVGLKGTDLTAKSLASLSKI